MIIKEYKIISVQAGHKGKWIFVQLLTDSGLTGMGEASQSGDDRQTQWLLEQKLLPQLIGCNALSDANRIMQQVTKQKLGQRVDGFSEVTAISSIEQALWDLRSQYVRLPLNKYLGGELRVEIPLYANLNRALNDRSTEAFAELAAKAVRDGFKAVKCTPFDGVTPFLTRRQWIQKVDEGIRRINAVRESIGPSIDLMVDCHGRFTASDSIWLAKELDQFHLFWVEDPVWSTEDFNQFREVRNKINTRLAGGERIRGLHEAETLIRERLVDVIMPDVKHCLGISSFLHIAAAAEVAGIGVAPHNPAGPISTAFSAQLCSVIPNLVLLEFPYAEVSWRDQSVTPEENITGGVFHLSKDSGNGVKLNMNNIAQNMG